MERILGGEGSSVNIKPAMADTGDIIITVDNGQLGKETDHTDTAHLAHAMDIQIYYIASPSNRPSVTQGKEGGSSGSRSTVV